ncbi:MAG TPA: M23 family metallopeptidase [Thermoanaerobaculia bacterium]
MLKRALAAAVTAAFLAISLPAVAKSGASSANGQKKAPAAKSAKSSSTKKAKASAPARKSSKAKSAKSGKSGKSGKSTAKSSKSGGKTSKKKKKATKVIRQNASGDVVIARIVRESYGPWMPLEAFDHPQMPCPPIDPVVIVATVHEQDEDSPEAADTIREIQQAVEPATMRDLTGLAQTVGAAFSSLVRPKSAGVKVKPEDVDLTDLVSAGLLVPVEGVDLERLRDSFLDRRGRYRKHLAIDIGAPRGTPILATTEGEIVRLTREKRGGIAIYQKDPTGRYLFFYGHLQKYAAGLKVGDKVARGQVIGYVGRTGHVVGGPHLHFSVTRMPEEGTHREGLAVNPYLLFLMGAN